MGAFVFKTCNKQLKNQLPVYKFCGYWSHAAQSVRLIRTAINIFISPILWSNCTFPSLRYSSAFSAVTDFLFCIIRSETFSAKSLWWMFTSWRQRYISLKASSVSVCEKWNKRHHKFPAALRDCFPVLSRDDQIKFHQGHISADIPICNPFIYYVL